MSAIKSRQGDTITWVGVALTDRSHAAGIPNFEIAVITGPENSYMVNTLLLEIEQAIIHGDLYRVQALAEIAGMLARDRGDEENALDDQPGVDTTQEVREAEKAWEGAKDDPRVHGGGYGSARG